MRTSLGLTVLSLMLVGCATTKSASNKPVSPCAQDLMDRGYVSGRGTRESAEAYCAQYTPGEIAIAKDLYDRKYEPRFAEGLTTAQAYTPAQIACAKKKRETWADDGKATGFTVPDNCVDASFSEGRANLKAAASAKTAPTPSESATAAGSDGASKAFPQAPAIIEGANAGLHSSLTDTAVSDAKHSLYDVVAADKRFSKFLVLVEFVGLTKTLQTGGPWTVLAPTNAAINRYPGGLEALKSKTDRLKVIVTLHLVDGARPTTDLKLPDKKGVTGKKWPTAQGRNLTITEKAGRIYVNDDVKVLKADIPADNGLVYIVDELLKP